MFKKLIIGMAVLMLLVLPLAGVLSADPEPGDDGYPAFMAGESVDTIMDDFSEIFWANVATILSVLGALIALFFLVRVVLGYIGGRR